MGSSPAKRATFPCLPTKGGLAQMVRASVLHTEGQRFESSIPHHQLQAIPRNSAHSLARLRFGETTPFTYVLSAQHKLNRSTNDKYQE